MDAYSITATAIVTLLATVLAGLIVAYVAKYAKVRSFENEILSFQNAVSALNQKIRDLQAENNELKAEIRPYKDREALFADCHFDEYTNTWVNESSVHFCPQCRLESLPKKSPLHNVEIDDRVGLRSYRCHACGWYNLMT